MRIRDSGKGRGKVILTLAIFAALVFFVAKTLPVYFHNYELQDYIRQVVIHATAGQRPTAEALRNNVVAKARDLELPVQNDNVKVVVTSSRVTIDLDYVAPIDLKVYTLNLHFHPSADNRALL
jgi:hypothetical protein